MMDSVKGKILIILGLILFGAFIVWISSEFLSGNVGTAVCIVTGLIIGEVSKFVIGY